MKIKELRVFLNGLSSEEDDCEIMSALNTMTTKSAKVGLIDKAVFKKDGKYFDTYSLDYSAEENGFQEDEWEEIKKNKCFMVYL